MANKCKLDIKFDLVDQVRNEALKLGGFRNLSRDTVEITDAAAAAITAKQLNDQYGEDVITNSVTSKSHYFIDPSGELVEKYFTNYKSAEEREAARLIEEEKNRGGYTDDQAGEFFQNEKQSDEAVDPEIDQKVRVFLEKLGVDVRKVDNLKDRAGNPLTGVAMASMLNKTIDIVEGLEDITTLPEEAAHFFVELLGEEHPLYKEMMGQITGFKIYSQTVENYKNMKEYRNADGTINFPKLKKEAVGKLIAYHIINLERGEETTTKLEGLQKWWKRVWDYITKTFFKRDVIAQNPFKKAATQIANADTNNLTATAKEDVYFQTGNLFDILQKDQLRITLDNSIDPKTKQKRHIYYVDGKATDGSVTSTKVDDYYKKKFSNDMRSETQKNIDLLKAEYGDTIHLDGQTIMKTLADPATGLARPVKVVTGDPIATNADVYKTFESYLTDLVDSYEPGTRFLTEVKIFDPKENIAGSIDLLVIKPSGEVDIYDWKSQEIYGNQTEIKDYKVPAYQIQLSEYKRILQLYYGVQKFGKVRAIPIRTTFTVAGRGDNRELKGLKTIEIGNYNPALIADDKNYLLPVTLADERTEDEGVDKLIKQLSKLHTVLLDKKVTPEELQRKREELAMVTKAIKGLQLKNSAVSFINLASSMISKYKKLLADDKITEKDVIESLRTLDIFAKSDSDLLDYDAQLAEQIANAPSDTEKAKLENIRERLVKMQREAKQVLVQMDKEMRKIATQIGKQNGIEGLLDPEKNIGVMTGWFNSLSTIDRANFKLFYKLLRETQDKRDRQFNQTNDELEKLRTDLIKWGEKKGIDSTRVFDAMLDYDKDGNWTGGFLRHWQKEFYTQRDSAIEAGALSWFADNTYFDAEAYQKSYVKLEEYYNTTTFSEDPEEDRKIRERAFENWQLNHDITFGDKTNPYAYYNKNNPFIKKKDKWETADWKNLQKPENAPLKAAYDYFQTMLKSSVKMGMIDEYSSHFLPAMYKDKMDMLVFGGSSEAFNFKGYFDELKVKPDAFFGEFDPFTGESIKKIPVYFTQDIFTEKDGKKDFSQKSTDLFKVFSIWGRQMHNYEAVKEIEDMSSILLHIERNKEVIEANMFSNVARENGEIKTKPGNLTNYEMLEDFVNFYLYGQRKGSESDSTFKNPFAKDQANAPEYSWMKLGRGALNFFSLKTLALNPLSGLAQIVGGTGNALFTSAKNKYYSDKDWFAGMGDFTSRNKTAHALINFFDTRLEDQAFRRSNALSVSKVVQTVTWDKAYMFQRGADEFVADPILLAMLRNNMVDDQGNIVDIQKHVRAKYNYNQGFYNLPAAERKELEKKMKAEIEDLKKNKSIRATAKIVNDKLEIPGVDRNTKTVQEFRNKVKKVTKSVLGNSTQDDINRVRTTMLGQALMQFRSWIPQMYQERFGDLKYDVDIESYSYGKARSFFNDIFSKHILWTLKEMIFGMTDISVNRGKVLYQQAMEDAYKKGEKFNISETEFIDMYKANLRSMFREILALMAFASLVLWAKGAGDDDDEPSGVKKYMARAFDKMFQEFAFYYSPGQFSSLFQNPFPVLGLANDLENLVTNTGKEVYGQYQGDEELMKGAHPMKYLYRLMPVMKEGILTRSIFDEEFRKDYGIKIER